MSTNLAVRYVSRALLATTLTLTVLASAQAIPTVTPNGSFAGADAGAITANGVANGGAYYLGTSTTLITLSGTEVLTAAVDPYNGTANTLSTANGGLINVTGSLFTDPQFTLSSYALIPTSGPISTLTLSVSGYTFKFTSETVIADANGTIDLAFLGNITGDTSGNLIVPAAADFSVSLTEAAPHGAIGASFSIDSPPNPALVVTTPEPATMAILGTGVLALAASRRRKR
jgi:hypothetical protein